MIILFLPQKGPIFQRTFREEECENGTFCNFALERWIRARDRKQRNVNLEIFEAMFNFFP